LIKRPTGECSRWEDKVRLLTEDSVFAHAGSAFVVDDPYNAARASGSASDHGPLPSSREMTRATVYKLDRVFFVKIAV
jgi:hypothetical protein